LNADKVMTCLKGMGGNSLTQGQNELDGLFCQQQNMGFNCRSCLICNYGNLNEDIKRRFQPTNTPSPSPTPSPVSKTKYTTYVSSSSGGTTTTSKKIEFSIFGISGLILLIVIILVISHFMKRRVRVLA